MGTEEKLQLIRAYRYARQLGCTEELSNTLWSQLNADGFSSPSFQHLDSNPVQSQSEVPYSVPEQRNYPEDLVADITAELAGSCHERKSIVVEAQQRGLDAPYLRLSNQRLREFWEWGQSRGLIQLCQRLLILAKHRNLLGDQAWQLSQALQPLQVKFSSTLQALTKARVIMTLRATLAAHADHFIDLVLSGPILRQLAVDTGTARLESVRERPYFEDSEIFENLISMGWLGTPLRMTIHPEMLEIDESLFMPPHFAGWSMSKWGRIWACVADLLGLNALAWSSVNLQALMQHPMAIHLVQGQALNNSFYGINLNRIYVQMSQEQQEAFARLWHRITNQGRAQETLRDLIALSVAMSYLLQSDTIAALDSIQLAQRDLELINFFESFVIAQSSALSDQKSLQILASLPTDLF